MIWLAVALVLQGDPELEEAVRADRARVEARKPLTSDERAAYVRPAAPKAAAKARSMRVAVIPLEFADVKRGLRDLDQDMKRLAEFYKASSAGALELTWQVLGTAVLDASRASLAAVRTGAAEEKRVFAAAAGSEAADAFVFVVAGGIGARGTALWPHQDALEASGRSVAYVVVPEEEVGRASWQGILAHEFAHVLGLDDKYEDRSANVGRWCLMGTGYLGDRAGNPMPLCGVCREHLGWAGAARVSLEPDAPQSLSLAPGEIARIPLTRDARESVVLEMRDARTLLVWRTGGGKPIELVTTFGAPLRHRDRLTPLSDPPLMGRLVGSWPLWLTDVRLEDGRAWMRAALEGTPTPLEELRRSRVGRELGK